MYKKIKHIISFRYNRLKNNFYNSVFFCRLKIKYLLPLGIYDNALLKTPLEDGWKERIRDVLDCPDNRFIERHPDAGTVKNGKQIMHNGIAITLGGYYGDPIAQMLYQNKGVHEPQEELAFGLVLPGIPEGGTMLELGSYWSFYSIWFSKQIKNAKNFLVEPSVINMLYGKNNCKLNKVKGNFTNAFVGRCAGKQDAVSVICVDDFVKANKIEFIDMLHSDIQGFEYEMLCGGTNTIRDNKVGYFFISTHGNEVHAGCLKFFMENNCTILCSADAMDTYSLDGLIVAKSKHYKGLEKIDITLKTKATAI